MLKEVCLYPCLLGIPAGTREYTYAQRRDIQIHRENRCTHVATYTEKTGILTYTKTRHTHIHTHTERHTHTYTSTHPTHTHTHRPDIRTFTPVKKDTRTHLHTNTYTQKHPHTRASSQHD